MSRALCAVRAAIATITIAGGASLSCAAPEPERPDVILLSVDTLRADRLGIGGRQPSPSPNLDRLAGEGTYFSQAITPMPRTTPGLASLFTGLWPHHHGSREVGRPILAGTTLTEILRERGYTTLAVSANSTAGPREGLAEGFDSFVTYEQIGERYRGRLFRDFTDAPSDSVGWAEAVTDEALRLLDSLDPEAPLFLWAFYFDPHFLYRPPSPWQDAIEADRCWELYEWGERNRSRAGEVFTDRDGIASAALEDCSALYDGEVAYVDHELARLIEELRRIDRFDDALVVFTADHGENLGEGGAFFEHGENVHDAALRVPLLLRGPGIAAGRIDEQAASLVDVAPTLLSLLGLPAGERPEADGQDLTPRLRPQRPAEGSEARVAFAESATSMWNDANQHLTTGLGGVRACLNAERFSLCRDSAGRFGLYDRERDPDLGPDLSGSEPAELERLRAAFERWPPESARYHSARTPRFKLVRSPRLEGGYTEALYDLVNDPAEQLDVLAQNPEEAARLRAALDRWSADLTPPGARPPEPDRLEALRSLGYVQ